MPYTPAVTPAAPLRPAAFEPVATAGIASETELYTIYDRPLPEQFDLFARHMQYAGFGTMLKGMGFSRMCSTPTTGHYEEDWLHELITVGSVDTAAVNPGDAAIIVLHADDHYDTGLGAPNVASYPVVGDVVELADGTQAQVTAKDTAAATHELTLTPLSSTGDISGIQADDVFGIVYNLHAEASGLPSGRAPRIFKYNNTFGVIKHTFGATGFELTNSVYHETIPGQPGSKGKSIYAKIERDELIRYEMSKSGLLVFGQQADNLVDTATALGFDTPISGSEGYVQFARTAGNQDTYTLGSYDTTDFDNAADLLLDERAAATNDLIGFLGPEIFKEIENGFTTTLVNNLIHTVDRIVDGYQDYMNQYHQALTRDGSDATLSFGYSAIRKNGFVFHMKRLSEFADVRRLGGSSYNYRSWAIWQPVSWTMDRLSNSNRPTIGYEYKGLGPYTRDNVFGSLAGAGVGGDNTPYGKAVTEYDTMRYFLMSHCGFHGAVANQMVVQQPA